MTDNLRHWSVLEKTDPTHTKGFQRSGGFKGTAIKPIYTTRKMTEHFGPCGVSWGTDAPVFTTMPAADEIMVFCTVALWYVDADKRATVYGVGGDKVLTKQSSGLRANDEAFKAAYTDALSNAMKQIGMSADVHMGLFDDHKYVSERQREAADEAKAAPATKAENNNTAKSYAIAVHPRDGGGSDWGRYSKLMFTSIGKAPDIVTLDKLAADNSAALKTLATENSALHMDILQTMAARRQQLPDRKAA